MSKKIEIFKCPFSSCEIIFNRQSELAYHFHKKHSRQCYNEIAKNCKKIVSKTRDKWQI